MKKIKTFEEFSSSLQEDAIDAGEDSKVVVDDVTLDSGKEIKSTEILGTILSSKSEKEFKEYFYKEYGNTAFTEEDMFTLVKFFNDYNEEVAQKEKDAEKDKEGGEGGGEEDPLADI
jgi:acyl-coenzyme A synthetase/AMP-(fatty) acid ligase